jgi:DNA-binding transcriptional MerR regulator
MSNPSNVRANRSPRRPLRTGGIRIGELARRAAVSRATIHHYVTEGLLPEPRKTSRTMAYYDPSCVDRIALIKDLKARYLPLPAIRRLVAAQGTAPSSRLGLQTLAHEVRAVLEPAERPLTQGEAAAEFGIEADTLREIERLGLVRADAEGRFGPHDVAVLRVLGRMRAAGLSQEAGFAASDLAIYVEATTALIAREVEVFSRTLAGRGGRGDIVRLAAVAATEATELVAALRRRHIVELLGAAMAVEDVDEDEDLGKRGG